MKWKWLKFLIAGLVVTAGVMICNNSLDNDSWYVLAEGREIVENGIYHEDQLSMHEGLEVTVQNYGFAVIFYLIYSVVGPVGIYVVMLLINLLLLYLIYKVCMLISNKNVNLSLLLAVLADLLLARWFVTTRAQMVSYCIIMLVILLLELYVRRKNTKYLWGIPLLSLLQINLHASLWLMIALVMVVYIIDSFRCRKLHLEGYKTWPLVVTLAAVIVAGFINPYGLRMVTFIFTSYGVTEANNYILELYAFRPLDGIYNILFTALVVGVMLLIIFGKKQNLRMRWLLMIFGFLALGINTIKGMSHLILVLMLPIAAMYQNVVIGGKKRKWWWMAGSWAGILGAAIIVTIAVVRAPEAIGGPNEKLIAAVDAIDADAEDFDKSELKIYVGYDQGGYVEYRGYKAYIDPRMEVFIKSNNGKEDIFKEYYDLEKGDVNVQEFLEKYDFDYLVVTEEEKLYKLDDESYKKLYENDEGEEDVGVRVYKKLKV